jgi:hypothetical protein
MPGNRGRIIRRVGGLLLAVAILGCGDGSTEPSSADVNGLYEANRVVGAESCSPTSALSLLERQPVPAHTDLETWRVRQNGALLTIQVLEINGSSVEGLNLSVVFSTDATGAFETSGQGSPEQLLSPAGLTVFLQSANEGSGRIDRGARPITITISDLITDELRVGSLTSPVALTCTTQMSITATRVGD